MAFLHCSPQFVPADEADFLSPEDRVLGIQGGREVKAYPIAVLNWHKSSMTTWMANLS